MYILALFINYVNPGKGSKTGQAKNNVKISKISMFYF